MNELDFLKKDWKKQEKNLPRLSYDDIYKMLWKKSSSIVKWIFVISILELFLSTFLNIILADEAYWKEMKAIHLMDFSIGLYIFGYSVTFYFIYLFYRNYRRISTTDDAATLMKNIINTRRTVKVYIAYVLIYTFVVSVIVMFFSLKYFKALSESEIDPMQDFGTGEWVGFTVAISIILALVLGLLWLFYRLIYGILLRRLHRNYKELKKLEV